MTTSNQKSMEEPGAYAKKWQRSSCPEVKSPARRLRNHAMLRTIIVTLIFGLWVALSVKCDFLFFRELLLTGSIIGLAALLKAIRHPAIIITRENNDQAHLN